MFTWIWRRRRPHAVARQAAFSDLAAQARDRAAARQVLLDLARSRMGSHWSASQAVARPRLRLRLARIRRRSI